MDPDRIIGEYTGSERGPLLIVLAGMHGNEPAGVQALDLMFKMLEVEPIANPDFSFCGRMIGMRGNVQALRQGTRYLERDLNRQLTQENVARVFSTPPEELKGEDLEIYELISLIRHEVATYQPERLVFLDIHTTTAFGGIFSIATDDPESIHLAVELHAPVITGMLDGIHGTTLHYLNEENFQPGTVAVVFEAGQHEEVLSVNRAIAAITNLMRTIGCVDGNHVENRHDSLLIEYSEGLPKVAELITTHHIQPGDGFQMLPDYKNFQPVKKGEHLAIDSKGTIVASDDGLILMPLYQKQGEDGFFLVRRIQY